eukprot:jgi/Botrbrau1/20672/Bobra.0058s0006.1
MKVAANAYQWVQEHFTGGADLEVTARWLELLHTSMGERETLEDCYNRKVALHHGERSQAGNHQGPAQGSEGDWDDLLIWWDGSGGTMGDHLQHSQGTGLQRPGPQSNPCGQGSHHTSSLHHTRDCKPTLDPSWRPGGPSFIDQGGGT